MARFSGLHLPKLYSDHRPIILKGLVQTRTGQEHKPFRFLAAWLTHEQFEDMVKRVWRSDGDAVNNSLSFMVAAREWNKSVFGHILAKKNRTD